MRKYLDYITLFGIFAMVVAGCVWVFYATDGPGQIQRTQKARMNFAVDCARKKGYQVRLRGGDVDVLCIGPDGRVVGKR